MNGTVLDQLARTGLLPDAMSASILAGDVPPLEELVNHLLIGAMDCEALTRCDSESTWAERRIARQCLVIAFLLAITSERQGGSESISPGGTADRT